MTESGVKDELLLLMRLFLRHEVDTPTFVINYQNAWRKWRDTDELFRLNRHTANAFDRAFTAADCYQPAEEYRTDWDIGENKLRAEIFDLVSEIDHATQ